MTSPVISVKNATTEYSGTYSCTVKNRVGSDQCLLRLDVVPRKLSSFCSDSVIFIQPPLVPSVSVGIKGKGMLTLSKAPCGLVASFSKLWKEKKYYILLIKPSLLL